MEPSEKSEKIEELLTSTFGVDRRGAITGNHCIPPPIGCGGDATVFRDEISKREFSISGMCQKCQDEVFGE